MNQNSSGLQASSRNLQLKVYSVEFTASARCGHERRATVHSRLRSCITHWTRQRWSRRNWKGVGVHVTRPIATGQDRWDATVHLVLALVGSQDDQMLKDLSRWGPEVDNAFSQKEQTFRDRDENIINASISAAKSVKVMDRIPSELSEDLRAVAQQFANETGQTVYCPNVGEVEPALTAKEVGTKTVSLSHLETGKNG